MKKFKFLKKLGLKHRVAKLETNLEYLEKFNVGEHILTVYDCWRGPYYGTDTVRAELTRNQLTLALILKHLGLEENTVEEHNVLKKIKKGKK